ncbi:Putative osmoprotectant uptake system permease protein yehW [Serratia marcescens]|uniref:ABC transporter permease n=1 Tax=Serratia marcescens TaxID=615 RepID=UPI0007453AAD|nr:ABC transporter permease [Serratia marcescens]CVA60665.1 Putative osmoprotectant uptake system permease protein yehW [Serratia marcescens]
MHKSAPYRRLLLGSLLFIAVVALLVYGIGWETLKSRREDLIYLGQQHMFLVACSMLLSLLVGIPSGILLSRPFARRWAEHVMQIFNVGNTLPPLAVLALVEAANGIGMTAGQRLRQVELPNALPVIFAGVRIAMAINVGTAPLAFLIGASSYGELIFPGIYLNDFPTLILGAAATALIALLLDLALAGLGRRLSPHTAS